MSKPHWSETALSLALTAGVSLLISVGFFIWVSDLTQLATRSPRELFLVQVGRPLNTRAARDLAPQVLGVALNTLAPDTLIRGSWSTLYYYAADGYRYVFPNERTFGSWFSNFGAIVTVADEVLAEIPLKGNITYRPGVRLVKLETSPRVYAVDHNGTLRWVTDETIAATFYGPDWSQKIDDIPDVFFTNYAEGEPITSATDYQPAAVVGLALTINQDRNLPQSQNAPRADTAVGSSTAPASEPAPVHPEDRADAAPPPLPRPAVGAEPLLPPTTPTSTPETPPVCPRNQQVDAARGGCAPIKDPACGSNGYRDRYGGCIQLPTGRTLVADWAVCGDYNCDLERGEHGGNCPADCPNIPPPPEWATSTPTSTPNAATPAVPAQPASPAVPPDGNNPAAPATPATPATPAVPATPTEPATSTPPTADTRAPTLTNIHAMAMTDRGVTIGWTTDEPASSQVEYGLTMDYGSPTALDQSLVTTHTIYLTGLTGSTTYYYRVKSQDASGNLAVSGSYPFYAFTTLPPPAAPAPNNTTLRVDRLFPGQYDNIKYKVILTDPDGIQSLYVRKADGSHLWSGFPPCITQLDTGTVDLQPADFPLNGTVTDCANPSNTHTVTASMPPLPPPTLACRDSDGGINLSVRGETYDEGATLPFTDACLDSVSVIEHWCEGGRLRGQSYACTSGTCQNGACISP